MAFKLPILPAISGMSIAVDAFQIAGPGHVPDHDRFLVYGELEEMGWELARPSSVTERIRRFYCSAI
jgi:hypothetical protein